MGVRVVHTPCIGVGHPLFLSRFQVRESTTALLRAAKALSIPLFLVGHVTKSGEIAGLFLFLVRYSSKLVPLKLIQTCVLW